MKPISKNKGPGKREGGMKKPHAYSHSKSGGAVGDNSMEEGDAWNRNGGGVNETVHDVGCMPNESVISIEDTDHLR